MYKVINQGLLTNLEEYSITKDLASQSQPYFDVYLIYNKEYINQTEVLNNPNAVTVYYSRFIGDKPYSVEVYVSSNLSKYISNEKIKTLTRTYENYLPKRHNTILKEFATEVTSNIGWNQFIYNDVLNSTNMILFSLVTLSIIMYIFWVKFASSELKRIKNELEYKRKQTETLINDVNCYYSTVIDRVMLEGDKDINYEAYLDLEELIKEVNKKPKWFMSKYMSYENRKNKLDRFSTLKNKMFTLE